MKLRETYEKEILKEFGIGHLNEVFVKEDINQEVKIIIAIIQKNSHYLIA